MASSLRQTQVESSGQDGLRLTLANGRMWQLDAQRPKVMGIVNITPDSFSDGGHWLQPEAAVDHALQLVDEGADLIDLAASQADLVAASTASEPRRSALTRNCGDCRRYWKRSGPRPTG